MLKRWTTKAYEHVKPLQLKDYLIPDLHGPRRPSAIQCGGANNTVPTQWPAPLLDCWFTCGSQNLSK